MRNIKITVEYDGTDFQGWQIQDPKDRTVQGEIESALLKIFKEPIRIFGSGRTDSGAHAKGQVANFKVGSPMPTKEIVNALNGNLPEDIVIIEAKEVAADFHAQFNAKRKTYRYAILNRKPRAVLERRYCWHYPYTLDLSLLRKEAKALVGKKDFRSFMASDPHEKIKEKSAVRQIYAIKITKKNGFLLIDITASGFLYKMVRNIVGTLVEAGTGRLPPGSLITILKNKNRTLASDTAPAKGLCLLEVRY